MVHRQRPVVLVDLTIVFRTSASMNVTSAKYQLPKDQQREACIEHGRRQRQHRQLSTTTMDVNEATGGQRAKFSVYDFQHRHTCLHNKFE